MRSRTFDGQRVEVQLASRILNPMTRGICPPYRAVHQSLDVFELSPSAHISRNEIDAAATVRLDYLNAQEQPHFVWPASFALARAYVDQLERSSGLATDRIAAVRTALSAAEGQSGAQRRAALTQLAGQLDSDARNARDRAKVGILAGAVKELAAAQ